MTTSGLIKDETIPLRSDGTGKGMGTNSEPAFSWRHWWKFILGTVLIVWCMWYFVASHSNLPVENSPENGIGVDEENVLYRPVCVFYGKNAKSVRLVQTSLGQPSQPWANLLCHQVRSSDSMKMYGAPDAVLRVNFSEVAHPDVNTPILGFGGAFTEAAALNYNTLSAKGKETFMELLFGESGLGYGFGRVHINSCDFSVESYSFDDVDGDFELEEFDMSVHHDVEVGMVDMIQTAMNAYKEAWMSDDGYDGNLRLFASPWSPPSWMKAPTPDDEEGAKHAETMTNSAQPTCIRDGVGHKSKYAKAWALYFSKFLTAYENLGIKFFSVSVQNEPEFPAPWEACSFDPTTEGDFVAYHLGPRMREDHPDVGIAMFDHNKDHINRWVRKLLNSTHPASEFVSGVAYHWYAGGMNRLLDGAVGTPNMHRLQDDLRELGVINDQLVVGIESCHCPSTGYAGGDPQVFWARAERYAHTILSDLAAGSNGWMEWNLLLDSLGGPNHLGNLCDSALLAAPYRAKDAPVNMSKLPEFETDNYTFGPNIGDGRTREELNAFGFSAKHLDVGIIVQPIYYYMGHISRYVRPGSVAVMGLVDVTGVDGALPFRPKGQTVSGGGMNDLAEQGIELTTWPCEGSTRQQFKWNVKKQIQVFGHDWLGKPTTSCVGKKTDKWFEGLLLTDCKKKFGTYEFVDILDVAGRPSINIVLADSKDPKNNCMVIRELKNSGGAYGPRGGAQVALGSCSTPEAVFTYNEATGEIASSYFSDDEDDDNEARVCMTTGWPFLQIGAFSTPNGETSRTVVVLNEARDAANYVLQDEHDAVLTGSIPPRSIQTLLID